MTGLFETIYSSLENGKPGVLATIIKRTGSVPQETGAKVFIGVDNTVCGSIGGGCVEAEAVKEAGDVLRGTEARIIQYSMDSSGVAEEGMICGGTVDIFLEPVLPEQLNLYGQILSHIKNGNKLIIATGYEKNNSIKTVIPDKSDIPCIAPDFIMKDINLFDLKNPVLKDGFLIEPVSIKNRLFIYGAGHISQYIAKIAGMIDFDVKVIDDRFSFANKERFPESEVIVGYFTETINELPFIDSDYHVIVTRGHRNDAEVLQEVIKKPSSYIGMIGSKRKIKLVFNHLIEKGIDPTRLKRVYTPIGIDINAVTPQEIAVSIAAELVQVRAGRD